MKRIIMAFAFILVLVTFPSSKIESNLATTYFGYCNPSTGAGTGSTNINIDDKSCWVTAGYACPGTGAQDIVTLGVYTNDSPGYPLNLALYDSVGDLVVAGTTQKACAYGDWVSWAAGELTWYKGTTLTGGATYIIYYTAEATNRCVGDTGTSGISKFTTTDYTDGFSATLPTGSNEIYIFNSRCGVQPAAAPPSMINNVLIIIHLLDLMELI